jgi:hypothetical protein
MCAGMFIALLDIQIVASSLQDIGGGLSAAQDEISWVQTAYLIAEINMIPLIAPRLFAISGDVVVVDSLDVSWTDNAAGRIAAAPAGRGSGPARRTERRPGILA